MTDAVPTPAEGGKWKIAIGFPSHDMCSALFAFDLAKMLAWTATQIGDRFDFGLHVVHGTYIHKARQELMTQMLDDGCHYMLWVDSDMRFPKDALIQLLARDLPMVGINYSTRGMPPRFVAIKTRTQFEEDGTLIHGKNLKTQPDSTGVEEVDAIGFGLVLMKAAITEGLPTDKPWFFYGWSEETRKLHVGEDVWFCDLVQKAGHKVHVDHDLSKECFHVGSLEYSLAHVWGLAEAEEAEETNGT